MSPRHPTRELAILLVDVARLLRTCADQRAGTIGMTRAQWAVLVRLERAALNPAKDQERMRQLAPYLEGLKRLETGTATTKEARGAITDFRWMVEEFKVSLFAQELGTSIPVSPRRLDEQLARARMLLG